MAAVVLDASALLALLLGEPGAEQVARVVDGAMMTSVNLAEIVSHYAKLGASRPEIEALLLPLPCRVIPVDYALCYSAGMLRPLTVRCGLSLGDRFWRWRRGNSFRRSRLNDAGRRSPKRSG